MTHTFSRRTFLSSLAVAAAALPAATSPGRRYLMLDQRNIDRAENAALRVSTAEKSARNPLFGEDKPWEVRYDNLYPNVRRDAATGLYQCWYSPFIVDPEVSETSRAERANRPYKPRTREMGLCYAESRDGITWTKPDLGLIEFEGSKKNNLVVRGPHGSGLYFDPHEADPAHRFKLFYEEHGLTARFSPDGKNWSAAAKLQGIDAVGDTHNNAIWVPSLKKYVGITRLWDRPAKQRLVGRTESPDFVNWTRAVEILRADQGSPESQTYSMPIFEYEGIFLGLATIFHTPTDTVHTELTWSPDTIHWSRIDPGSPVIALGPAGSVDSHCAYAAVPIFEKDEMRIYYGGSNGPHTGWRNGFFCLATLRPGRFAGFEPKDKGNISTVVTKPARVTSADLRINVNAERGQVRIGVIRTGETGAALSTDHAVPLKSDALDASCRWNRGDLHSLVGKEVQLVFELRDDARVYGFRFA